MGTIGLSAMKSPLIDSSLSYPVVSILITVTYVAKVFIIGLAIAGSTQAKLLSTLKLVNACVNVTGKDSYTPQEH